MSACPEKMYVGKTRCAEEGNMRSGPRRFDWKATIAVERGAHARVSNQASVHDISSERPGAGFDKRREASGE